MQHDVIMPALGMAQDTGLLVAWHKRPGDPVAAGDILFEVETDKSTMEVEAQADGFLVGVSAADGDEVPVGQVIARISDSAEDAVTDIAPVAPASAAAAPALPKGNNVIMPALGMAQDTGLIVAWHKAPGDPVAAGDILFEVETDKSTMEVEAGFDGFVAALLAEAGEDAPVGETIAIISAEAPETPIRISRAGAGTSAEPAPQPEAPKPAPAKPAPAKPAPAKAAAPLAAGGRILASPKARRLAREQGLDLNRLVEAGHPQPYHAADLDALRKLPVTTPTQAVTTSRHLIARTETDGFTAFADWAAQTAGLTDPGALMVGLAGASLGRDIATIEVESFGQTRVYSVPQGSMSGVTRAAPDAPADLRVRDLRASRISGVQMGAEDVPVLTLTRSGAGLSITLEYADSQLCAIDAITLLSEFAGRMEQPLRHLL